MAIEKFEEGHWYRWIGPKERQPAWNRVGEMDFILDGKPYQACDVGPDPVVCNFVGHERQNGNWAWEYLHNFEEVSSLAYSVGHVPEDETGEDKVVILSHLNGRRSRILESLSID